MTKAGKLCYNGTVKLLTQTSMRFFKHRDTPPSVDYAELLTPQEHRNLAAKVFVRCDEIVGASKSKHFMIKRDFRLSTGSIMALSGFHELLGDNQKILPNGTSIPSIEHALTLDAPRGYSSKDPIVVEPFLLADGTVAYEGGQGRHRLLKAFMEGQRTVQVDIVGPRSLAEMRRFDGIAVAEHTIALRGTRR